MSEIQDALRRPTGLLCPACRVDLVMSERQKIEIDYCPNCRGVWLDRGELDKIIERSAIETGQMRPRNVQPDANRPRDDEGSHRDEYRSSGHHGGGYRRKSWMQELFD
jgi:Zn-finger nucleic acid-binding protein